MKRSPATALHYLTAVSCDLPKPLAAATADVLAYPGFKDCWGGEKHHHTYDGGLVVHTAEVMDHARSAGMPTSRDNHVLYAAVIAHDLMKVKDYKRALVDPANTVMDPATLDPSDFKMVTTEYKRKIHHVQGSAIEFAQMMRKHGVSDNTYEAILHCILSHHGRLEWGSVIEPATPEACVLHFADMMSMQFGEGR